jgi:uncharacterized LabA/DUF88 family protein
VRSHSALYVDAGYLVAAAATRATGSSFRAGVDIDYEKLVIRLVQLLEEQTALPILRVYWYDAARDGKATPSQEQIAILPKVKLRLGRIGVDGEQKGVDLRIGLDMVSHARNGAVDTMYLISGDDDLTEAVEEAQAQGVQVVILAVPTASGTPQGVSHHLRLAADDIEVLTSRVLDDTVTAAARKANGSSPASAGTAPPPTVTPTPTPGTIPTPADLALRIGSGTESSTSSAPVLDPQAVHVAISTATRRTYDAWSATASDSAKKELHAGRPSIPRDLDRALLVDVSEALKTYTLDDHTRVQLRTEFWRTVDEG